MFNPAIFPCNAFMAFVCLTAESSSPSTSVIEYPSPLTSFFIFKAVTTTSDNFSVSSIKDTLIIVCLSTLISFAANPTDENSKIATPETEIL